MSVNPFGSIRTATMSLMNEVLPVAVRELLLDFIRCDQGRGIIHEQHMIDIFALSPSYPALKEIDFDTYAKGEERERHGPTMTVEDAEDIVKQAELAQTLGQNKAGWNMMVNWPLLTDAMGFQDGGLVFATPITSAKMIKDYFLIHGNLHLIHFAIVVNSRASNAAYTAIPPGTPTPATVSSQIPLCNPKVLSDIISKLYENLPERAINHIESSSLWKESLNISIQTRENSPDDEAEAADQQLCTHHSAQWQLLEDLVSLSGGSFEGLPFLPAVTVTGHYWSLVVTTRVPSINSEEAVTTLWTKQAFGSTDDVVGVYKVIWGLQRLQRWVEKVFWPWYRVNALGLPSLTL